MTMSAGDTSLLTTLQPIFLLQNANDYTGALVELDKIAIPADITTGVGLHTWFQVNVCRMYCLTHLARLDEATAIADQLILVDPNELKNVQRDFWCAYFAIGLIVFMRAKVSDFMASPAMQPYRDFIQANSNVDESNRGRRVYEFYTIASNCASDHMGEAPSGLHFDELLDLLTPENITFFSDAYVELLQKSIIMLQDLSLRLNKDELTMQRVTAAQTAIAALNTET